MNKSIFGRALALVLSIAIVVVSIPFSGMISAVSPKTFSEDFENLDRWEDMAANYRMSTSPSISAASSATTHDGKTVLKPAQSQGRASGMTAVKTNYLPDDRKLETITSSFYVAGTGNSSNADSSPGIYALRINEYNGLALQINSYNGYLNYQWLDVFYKEGATQGSATVNCSSAIGSTRKTSTKITTSQWITVTITYDYSKIEENKLTVTAVFSAGNETETIAYTKSFEESGYNAYSDNFRIGVVATGSNKNIVYFDNFVAQFSQSEAEIAGEFATKYADILSLSAVITPAQADRLFVAINEFNGLGDATKAELSSEGAKLNSLKSSYLVTEYDFEGANIFNSAWESAPDIDIWHATGGETASTQTQAAQLVADTMDEGNTVLLPEYRSVNRKRRIFTVKEEYMDAQINSFSTDVRIDAGNSFDRNPGIYFYFKDRYNWQRIEFQVTGGVVDVRFMYAKGNASAPTSAGYGNSYNVSLGETGKWINIKVDYDYTALGTNLTFTFTDKATGTEIKTINYTTDAFNSGARVGYGSGNNINDLVYFDNISLTYELTAAQFKSIYADVLNLSEENLKDSDTELILAAVKAYEALSSATKDELTEEQEKLQSLQAVLEVSVFKNKYAEVLALTPETANAAHKDDILSALEAFEKLNAPSKEALATEFALLQSLEAVSVSAYFKAEHATVLDLTTSTVTAGDKAAILAALDEYNSLSANAKAALVTEFALLQSLEGAVVSKEFEAKYNGLLSIGSISNDDELNLFLSAIEDYAALSDNVKAAVSTPLKDKINALKIDYFGTTGITGIDFENEVLFNKVWQILGGSPAINTPGQELEESAKTKDDEIVTVGGKKAYLPEYRANNRQRSIAVIKDAFNKEGSKITKYSVDVNFEAVSTQDANACVYFYYKDINNWGRLQWTIDSGVLNLRAQVNTNGTATMPINNWKISGASLNKWYTLNVSYKYYSTYTDVTFELVSDGTVVGSKTLTCNFFSNSTKFNIGIGAGNCTAANVNAGNINNKVYFSNININWTLADNENDMQSIKAFLNDYADVLNMTPSANATDSQKERITAAIAAFYGLRAIDQKYLEDNNGIIVKLKALCSVIKDENVDLFRENHKAILAKTLDSVTIADKAAIYAALMEYNRMNPIGKMALYDEGELLKAMAEKFALRQDGEDFTPFYDDFESGLDKWAIDYASSEDYIADAVPEVGNESNSVLKVQGNVIYITPTNTYWPQMGKMVKLKLRVKYEGYTGFNPPRIIHSYKDKNNYHGGGLTDDSGRYNITKMLGGVHNYAYATNKEERLNVFDWVDVEISLDDKNATIIFTDSEKVSYAVTQAYFESGRIAIGFNDNGGLSNKHPSKYVYVDDVYAEFVKGDWDIDEVTKEIFVYNTGNTWHGEDDIVTVSGAKLGYTVKSAKMLLLENMNDVITDYGYLEEGNFENNGKSYVIPAKDVDIDFSAATNIKFLHVAEDSFQFIIPKDFGKGIYAVELTPAYKGQEKKVILINRPFISAVMGNDGKSASQGGTIRIIGHNLAPTGNADDITVVLRNLTTNTDYFFNNNTEKHLSIYENDNYNITLKVPSNLPKGEYAVLVHNGYGTNYAYSAPDKIIIADDIRASWPQKVFNVLDYGAIGDGNENDTGAIMNALIAAGKNGGGIVYLPSTGRNKNGADTSGIYSVVDTLFIPENVVLKGDGAEVSMIVWNAIKWKYFELPDTLLAGTENFEIRDISLRGTRAYNYIKTYKKSESKYDYSENKNIYVTNINAYFYRRNGQPSNGGQSGHANSLMTTPEIEIALMQEMKDSFSLSITGSNVQFDGYILSTDKQLTSSACRAAYMHTEYLQVRNSHIMKGTFHGTSSYGAIIEDSKFGPDGPQFMGLAHAYVARNQYFEQTQNNHELLLNDGKWNWGGAIQFVTPELAAEWNLGAEYKEGITFRVTKNKPFKEDAYNQEMLIVATGQGVGQARKIVDVFTEGDYSYLVVNQPFAVNPNRNSEVYIEEPRERRYVINCSFRDGGCYGTYGSDIGGIYDGNTASGFFGHVYFNAVYACLWYESYVNNTITATNYVHGEGSGGSDGNVAGHVGNTHVKIYMHTDYTTGGRGFLFRNNNFVNGANFQVAAIGTRQIADIIFEDNFVDKAEYALTTASTNDYGFFDGMTVYNNDFSGCSYDYKSSVLNDLEHENNKNSMGYYNAMVIGDNGSTATSFIKGDVNLDGKVTLKDVTYIRYYLVGMILFDETGKGVKDNVDGLLILGHKNFLAADYDEDGIVTLRDALLIRESLLT
ncbi:MAG: DUF4469 domain-containing protein [Clostridia bacterium]|nr:DUF4469 domain-containing protein [Clostridia bacterium]